MPCLMWQDSQLPSFTPGWRTFLGRISCANVLWHSTQDFGWNFLGWAASAAVSPASSDRAVKSPSHGDAPTRAERNPLVVRTLISIEKIAKGEPRKTTPATVQPERRAGARPTTEVARPGQGQEALVRVWPLLVAPYKPTPQALTARTRYQNPEPAGGAAVSTSDAPVVPELRQVAMLLTGS